MIRSAPTAQNTSALNEAFIAGGQQYLAGGAQHAAAGGISYPVRRTAKRQPGRVGFELDGIAYGIL